MRDLDFGDIKIAWHEMERPSWLDFRTVLENQKHKPDGMNHDLAEKLIDKTYEFEIFPFPENPEDLYNFLTEN